MLDTSTIVLSGVVALAASLVAAGATVYASKGERDAALARDVAERKEQRRLFDETLRRDEADRFRSETELLEAVVAELEFNLTLPSRVQVNRAFVLFELDVMRQATREIGALPFDTRVQVQEARYAMLAYNSLAAAVNRRQPGVSIATEPPLNPDDLPRLAGGARPVIDLAKAKLQDAIKERWSETGTANSHDV